MVAAGDGSIKLFDITLDEFPIQSWQEHKREVFAVHWNLVTKDTFCSSSWDGTIKIVLCPFFFFAVQLHWEGIRLLFLTNGPALSFKKSIKNIGLKKLKT